MFFFCNVVKVFDCWFGGGGGGGGKVLMFKFLVEGVVGKFDFLLGYGGNIGIFCMVEFVSEDWLEVESELFEWGKFCVVLLKCWLGDELMFDWVGVVFLFW